MTNWKKITFEYVCPTIGVFISTALYSAPVKVSVYLGYQSSSVEEQQTVVVRIHEIPLEYFHSFTSCFNHSRFFAYSLNNDCSHSQQRLKEEAWGF